MTMFCPGCGEKAIVLLSAGDKFLCKKCIAERIEKEGRKIAQG